VGIVERDLKGSLSKAVSNDWRLPFHTMLLCRPLRRHWLPPDTGRPEIATNQAASLETNSSLRTSYFATESS